MLFLAQNHSTMLHGPIIPNDPAKQCRIMDQLKDKVLKLANSNPDKPLTPSQIALIEKSVLDAFSSHKTPTHPPYAWMIQEAVKELDSLTNEEKICEYIQNKFEGLPWAHKRYLKHHLDKMCEIGDLIMDVDGCYAIPGKDKRKGSRRKLQRKSVGMQKEGVVEEGNVAEEEMTELTDVQVCFEEEPSQGLGRGKRKRRRSLIIDYDDDEDVVETTVVVEEGVMDSNSELVVTEIRNELLLLEDEEVDCKGEERGHITAEDDHGPVDVSEGICGPQIDTVCSKEIVKSRELEAEHDLCDGKGEPELCVAPSNVMKILPVEGEGENMQFDDNGGAGLMIVPVESVKESTIVGDHHHYSGDLLLEPVEVYPLKERGRNPFATELMDVRVPYVDNARNFPVGKQLSPLLKSKYPIIVCGLPFEKPKQPKKKTQVRRKRKRLELMEEKLRAAREISKPASPVSPVQKNLETKLKRKSLSPKSKELPPFEDGSVKQLGKLESSHPISLQNFSMEDEETLGQVMAKCRGKKHGKQRAMLKVASATASSKGGAHLPKELSSLENFVEMTPRVEKEPTLTNGTEQERQQKKPNIQLRSQDKGCENEEQDAAAATESRRLSSSFLDEEKSSGSERHENQLHMIAHSTTGCQPDCVQVKYQEQHQEQSSCDSELVTTPTSGEAMPTGKVDHLCTGNKRQNPKILGLDSHAKVLSPDCPLIIVPSLQSLDGIGGQPERCQLQVSHHNSQATAATLGQATVSKPKETTEGFVTSSLVEVRREEGASKPTGLGSSDNQQVDKEKPHLLLTTTSNSQATAATLGQATVSKPKETTEGLVASSLVEIRQEKGAEPTGLGSSDNKQVEKEKPHMLLTTTSNLAEPPSQLLEHVMEDNEVQFQSEVTHQGLELQLVELHQQEKVPFEPTGHRSSDNQQRKQEKPHMLLTTMTNVAEPPSQLLDHEMEDNEVQPKNEVRHQGLKSQLVELYQQEKVPFEPTGHGSSDNLQPEQEKPHMLLTMTSNLAEPPSQILEHEIENDEAQCINQGTHQGLEAQIVEVLQQEEVSSELTGHRSPDNQQHEQEKPHMLLLATPSLAEPVSQLLEHETEDDEAHCQSEVAHQSLEPLVATFGDEKGPVVDQHPQPKNKYDQVNPQKLMKAIEEDAVYLSDSHNQVREELSEPASHLQSDQLNKQLENDCQGKPWEQKGATSGDAANSLTMDHEQGLPSVSAADQYPKHQNIQQEKRARGRPRKSEISILKDAADSLKPLPTSHKFSDHRNKQLNQSCDGVRTRQKRVALEDVADPTSLHIQDQERPVEATIQISQQKNKLLKHDTQRMTRKQKAAMEDAADASDPSCLHLQDQEGPITEIIQQSQQEKKLLKQESQDNAADLLDPRLKDQEGLSGTETSQHLWNKKKQLDNTAGQERPRKPEEGTIEPMDPSNFHLLEQQGPDLSSGQAAQQENKELKKMGHGKHWKEDATESLKLLDQQIGLSESMNNQQPQTQNKKRKRGRPKKNKGDEDDESVINLSHQENDDGLCEQVAIQHSSSQNSQLKDTKKLSSEVATKSGAAPSSLQLPDSASYAIPEASSTESQVEHTTCHIISPDFALSASATSEAPTGLADQLSQGRKNCCQPRRKSARISEASKDIFHSQNGQQHDLEPSNRRKLAKMAPVLVPSDHQCLGNECEVCENEVHGKPIELEQAEPVEVASDNQHHQIQSEGSNYHDHGHKKMEVQAKLKEKPAKSAPIHVPLSSKDLLRSRIRRLSQGDTS